MTCWPKSFSKIPRRDISAWQVLVSSWSSEAFPEMALFLSGSAVNWSVGTESADGDGDLVGESVAVVKVEKCACS